MMKYGLLFFIVLTIPVFWGINAWQSTKCAEIRNEVRKIEREQEDLIEYSKITANEINGLLAVERLESEAQRMGLRKMRPEDIVLIIMGGKERGY